MIAMAGVEASTLELHLDFPRVNKEEDTIYAEAIVHYRLFIKLELRRKTPIMPMASLGMVVRWWWSTQGW